MFHFGSCSLRGSRRCLLAAALGSSAAAAAAPAQLSLEGFSGFGVIPHAQVLDSGTLAAAYSNLAPSPALTGFARHAFGIGWFDRVELSGRVLEGPPVANELERIRDLAAGLKLQLFRREGWPSLAIGSQDLQGNRVFPSRYAVTSWQLGPVHLSAGYGWDSENLAGRFGGIEWQPARWIAASAEHTQGGDRVSLRLTTPAYRGITLSGLAAHPLDDRDGDTRYGVQLSLPLAGVRAPRPVTPPAALPAAPATPFAMGAFADAEQSLTYCVDDRRAHRNPQDALGAALRQLRAHIPTDARRIRLVLVRDEFPALVATTTPQALESYFGRGENTPPELAFAAPEDCAPRGAPAVLRPRRAPVELVLEPNLVSFVATEYGVLDADLSLRARLQLPLLRGLGLLLSALSPSLRSADFDDGRNFEHFRSEAGIDQGLLQWYGHPSARWHTLTSLGHLRLLQDDALVLLQEHVVFFGRGRDSLRLNLGAIDNDAGSRAFGIAEYAHHFVRHDTSLALAGGRFAAGDDGGRLELTRFFGDTAITAFVKAAGRDSDSAGGLRISFPLAGRYSPGGGFVVRGAERWSHSQQTTFSGSASGNVLRPNLLIEPQPDRNLRESYLNLYRATPAWIGAHSAELQEAYWGD